MISLKRYCKKRRAAKLAAKQSKTPENVLNKSLITMPVVYQAGASEFESTSKTGVNSHSNQSVVVTSYGDMDLNNEATHFGRATNNLDFFQRGVYLEETKSNNVRDLHSTISDASFIRAHTDALDNSTFYPIDDQVHEVRYFRNGSYDEKSTSLRINYDQY